MPQSSSSSNNKKKNKQKKKGTSNGTRNESTDRNNGASPNNASTTDSNTSNADADAADAADAANIDWNAQVKAALVRLEESLALLDERHDPPPPPAAAASNFATTSTPAVQNTSNLHFDGSSNIDGVPKCSQSDKQNENFDESLFTKDTSTIPPLGDSSGCNSAAPPTVALPSAALPNAHPSALPLSHWRILPLEVESAYKILNDGAEYIHATSTKYALVGKVDSVEGGKLAVELRKGAELIGTGTLLLFSTTCGSSRSLRHYVKQSARAVLASLISLVQSFEDGSATSGTAGTSGSAGTTTAVVIDGRCSNRNSNNSNNTKSTSSNDNHHFNNNLAAQKTGAVWSACEQIQKQLPKGNRAAMRRELMVWVRDCNESIEEFEEIMELGPRLEKILEGDEEEGSGDEEDEEGGGEGGEEDRDDDMMFQEQEQYTEREMKVVKASVNVMKCSKNVLGLVLKACECVGEHIDEKTRHEQQQQHKAPVHVDGQEQQVRQTQHDQAQSPSTYSPTSQNHAEVLQWISNLHELARKVGEGVTDFGILLYPPLDLSSDASSSSSLKDEFPADLDTNNTQETVVESDTSTPLEVAASVPAAPHPPSAAAQEPPPAAATVKNEGLQSSQDIIKPNKMDATTNNNAIAAANDEGTIPKQLGSSSSPSSSSSLLAQKLLDQLHFLTDCVKHMHDDSHLPASASGGSNSIRNRLSEEVVDMAEKLTRAVQVRGKEVQEAMAIKEAI